MAPGRCGQAMVLAIAVCGLWPAAALAAPGDLDPSFSGDGKVTLDFGSGEDSANDVAVQADGKIIVSGFDDDDDELVLVRYNPDGTLDTTFGGGDGIATSDVLSYGLLALMPDGAIMVASGDGDFILGRFTPTGSLDTSFGGGDGKVTTDFGDEELAVGVSVASDGRIAAAGGTGAGGTPGNEYDFAVARYLADGTLDTAFAGDGLTTLGFDGFDHASAVAALASGKVLVAGTGVLGGKMHVTLARYTESGVLDSAFGDGDGIVTSDLGAFGSNASGLALQANGRIVVAGNGGDASDDLLLARYDPDGSLDTTFGDGDGSALVDFKGDDDWATDLALQADGRIVAVGTARNPGGFDDEIAVARLFGDDVPPVEEEPSQPPEEPSSQSPPSSTPTAAPPPVGAAITQPSRPPLAVAFGIAPIRGATAFVRLRCRGQAACRGVAKLLARVRFRQGARRSAKRVRNVVLGRSSFRVPAGKVRLLRIRLNQKGRRLLRQAGRRGMRVRLVGRGLRNRAVQLKRSNKRRNARSGKR